MNHDHAAPLRPTSDRLWIVRWVTLDQHQTKHRMFFSAHHAQRLVDALRDDGREAAMFTTFADWKPTS